MTPESHANADCKIIGCVPPPLICNAAQYGKHWACLNDSMQSSEIALVEHMGRTHRAASACKHVPLLLQLGSGAYDPLMLGVLVPVYPFCGHRMLCTRIATCAHAMYWAVLGSWNDTGTTLSVALTY